jgi:hypothetical protein
MDCCSGSKIGSQATDETKVSNEPEFDALLGHKKFAATAFNHAWDFINLKVRTDEEVRQMLDAAHASSWHWRHREDATAQNRSIADWQLSRVHALAGNGAISLDYGNLSLDRVIETGLPFYMGYAYEAIARANWVLGNLDDARTALASAYECLDQIPTEDQKVLLRPDLDDIAVKIGA